VAPTSVVLNEPMLIHPWDEATKAEWQEVLTQVDFGQIIATGHGRDYPVVVPTHFHYDGADQVWLHLARPNPVWKAIEEHPHVVLAVITDYTYVEAAWNADSGVPPEHGVPTSYYTAVQLRCRAEIVDGPDEKFAILAAQLEQLEPDNSERVPPTSGIDTDRRLVPGIRGLRLRIESVQAKMKYGGNKTPEQRAAIAEHLAERDGPMDAAARARQLSREVDKGRDRQGV